MFLNLEYFFSNLFVFVIALENIFGSKNINEDAFSGKLATRGQFPFAARLYSKLEDFTVNYCTAAIISYSKLLTAGHCCRSKGVRFVVSGDPDQTDFVASFNKSKYFINYVKKVIIHPGFERSDTKLVYDLCLLILEKPLRPRDGHSTIQVSYEKLQSQSNCTALGWGSNLGHELQHKLYYKKALGYRCNLRFGNSTKYWFVCLEPHTVCPGDSGGPLICDGKLYGIASFFISQGNEYDPKCEEGVVDYFSEVYTQRQFIEKTGENHGEKLKFSFSACIFLTFYIFLKYTLSFG